MGWRRDASVEEDLRAVAPEASDADALGGADALRDLRALAHEADLAAQGGDAVLIVPGVMGSTLGVRGRLVDLVYWLDPVDVVLGHLARLALDDGDAAVEPLGVILPVYLRL